MHQSLLGKMNRCANGRVFASVVEDGKVALVCLGTYPEVRHRYNQMVCLLGGALVQALSTMPSTSVHSRSAPPGAWFSRTEGLPLGDADQLFTLAAMPPSEAADTIGYQSFFGDWPVGATTLLSGYKSMVKSLSEVSNVFYGNDYKSTAQIGCSADVSAVKRAMEALAQAKRKGYAIYEEEALRKFLKTLETGRFIHFFHEVHTD